MANENDVSFELDAGKLLATLHLAAAQAIPNSIAINTGIIDPQAKPNPEQPGKTTFNVDNKSKEYQIGIIKSLSYKVQIDLKKNDKLTKAYDEFKKAEESEKHEKNESTKILSFSQYLLTEETEDGLLDKPSEDDKSEESTSDKKNEEKTSNDIVKGTKSYESALKIIEIYEEYIAGCDKSNFKNAFKKYDELKKAIDECKKYQIEIDNKKVDALKDFKKLDKLFQEAVEEENKDRNEHKKKNIEEIKKSCIVDLKKYVETYSGKENSSKIRDTECVLFDVDIDGSTKDATQFKNIIDFKIQTKDLDDKIKKMEEEYQKTKYNEWITRNIGYYITFSLNFED